MEEYLLKPKQVARMLSMSVPWVYKAAKRGVLPCVEMPSLEDNGKEPVRFKREDIIEFVKKHHSLRR
jgi:predicted DNA-binding transcriptional regulator AlpA